MANKVRIVIELSQEGLSLTEAPADKILVMGMLSMATAIVHASLTQKGVTESKKPASNLVLVPPGTTIKPQ